MQMSSRAATAVWEQKHGLAAVPVYWLNTIHISARSLASHVLFSPALAQNYCM